MLLLLPLFVADNACADQAAEGVKPAPDVNDAEWDKFKSILDGISSTIPPQNYLIDTWYKWCNKIHELRSTKVVAPPPTTDGVIQRQLSTGPDDARAGSADD